LKIYWRRLIFCLLVPLGVGGLAAFLTRGQTDLFDTIAKPPLTPPAWVFPVAWSILYLLMGYASYRLAHATHHAAYQNRTLILYGIQLFFNFVWPLLFFGLRHFGLALVWLVLLWGLVLWMLLLVRRVDKPAAWLQVPYLLWVSFAAYLNYGVWVLNR